MAGHAQGGGTQAAARARPREQEGGYGAVGRPRPKRRPHPASGREEGDATGGCEGVLGTLLRLLCYDSQFKKKGQGKHSGHNILIANCLLFVLNFV